MKKRLILLTFILLAACRQELTTTVDTPIIVTNIVVVEPTATVTSTPVPTTPPTVPPPTATPVTFPAQEPLPSGPVSMIAIGGSITQGVGDETGQGYPTRMLALLPENYSGFTVTNFGQAGWDSNDVIQGRDGFFGQLPRAVSEIQSAAKQGRSTVVFVWVGGNDLLYLYGESGETTAAQEDQNLTDFTANMDAILFELRNAGARVIVALLDDQSKRPLSSEFLANITPDELTRMSRQVGRYNEVIRQTARQYGASTVDFYTTDIFQNPANLSSDGLHPNAAGYELIARTWFEALLLLLP